MQAMSPGPFLNRKRQHNQHISEQIKIIHIFLECDFPADGFCILRFIGDHFPVIYTGCKLSYQPAVLAKTLYDLISALLYVPDCIYPYPVQLLSSLRSNSVKRLHFTI